MKRSNKKENNEEFYVGYLAESPKGITRFIRWIIVILVLMASGAGLIIAKNQKKLSTATFEKNQLTEITGVIFHEPVPCIKVVDGEDNNGNPALITIPLIGYGKHGADGILHDWEGSKGIHLDNKLVTLRGRLIYHDGKTLMEINEKENQMIVVKAVPGNKQLTSKTTDLGSVTIKGEIIDPKCYFGVMKPGEGKPHRDCAIRCISGGMPPTLEVMNEKGESNYILLLGKNGEEINQQVLGYVAEPVSIRGNLFQVDDWLVMRIDPKEGISR